MYLLDTQVLLWWLLDPSRLSAAAAGAIRTDRTVYVSAASTWEIAIKKGLGKLTAPDDLEERISENRFLTLPVTVPHTLGLLRLPGLHSDPFDRLLIAQAVHERLTLVTRDGEIRKYPVPVLAA